MGEPASEAGFEQALHRLFADAPPRADAALFAAQVRERIERGWMWRRILISLAGVLGGFLTVWQLAGATALSRVGELSRLPVLGAWREAVHAMAAVPGLSGFPFPMELMWLVAGLLLLATGFLVTRAVDEF